VIPVAKHVETKLVDDIDGAEAAETVLFSLDAASYEIDLSTQHAAKLSAITKFPRLEGLAIT
jgi:hypothetical protein